MAMYVMKNLNSLLGFSCMLFYYNVIQLTRCVAPEPLARLVSIQSQLLSLQWTSHLVVFERLLSRYLDSSRYGKLRDSLGIDLTWDWIGYGFRDCHDDTRQMDQRYSQRPLFLLLPYIRTRSRRKGPPSHFLFQSMI